MCVPIMSSQRKHVGFWASDPTEATDNLPWPQSREELPLDEATLDFLDKLAQIENDSNVIGYKGYSWCRICKKDNGSKEYFTDQYIWPQGYAHYVREHNVEVPEHFRFYIVKTAIKKN